MRKRFGILLGDARPVRLNEGRFKLYDDARAEIFAGHNETTVDEYHDRVNEACSFLEGKAREWLSDLDQEMKLAADNLDFERAAELRDLVSALRETVTKTRKFKRPMLVEAEDLQITLGRTKDVLALQTLPRLIECFDVSHVSGTFVVASMVRFLSGKPDRKSYRRYKIRGFEGNDDFRAMEEVIGRRYGRLVREGGDLPDLVVVDGGLGQVSSALRSFMVLGIESLPLVGLAKRAETLVFPDERGELKLERRDPALRLLQRLRDEAHRFANQFNADLRSRRIRESVLDDFPGIGSVRRDFLLDHFGTIEKLRAASEKDLMEVKGIGPKLAAELALFLDKGKVEP